MTSPRAAIYCRLSEEDRVKSAETDDSESIQNQKSMLLRYALQQGWEVAGIYSDDDYAGADRRRPEFNRLLEDAQNRLFDIVLCKTQSRFTRELELVEKYIHGLFPIWGIRFVSIVDNADTDNRGNKKSRQINGLVNEWYLEDMSDNIRSVLTNKRQNGAHIGAFALYGYRKDPDRKGHLLVDEEAAAVVRQVFSMFSQGYGKTAIARALNSRGIPNPTEYKRLHGLGYRQPAANNSTLWSYSAIAGMLANEIYIGNMVQGKYGSASYKTKQNRPRPRDQWYRVEGTHEPVVSRELWDQVQELLRQRAKPFAGGSIGLFARKVRCASCGHTLRSAKSRGRHYLQCPSRRLARDSCPGAFISADKLEQAVLAELRRLTAEFLDCEALKRQIRPAENPEKRRADLVRQIAAWERERHTCAKAMGDLYLDKAKGLVTEQDYVELARDFSARRERLEQAADAARAQLEEVEKMPQADDLRQLLVQKYTCPDHLTREMVQLLIDFISVGRREPGSSAISVEIHWNF